MSTSSRVIDYSKGDMFSDASEVAGDCFVRRQVFGASRTASLLYGTLK